MRRAPRYLGRLSAALSGTLGTVIAIVLAVLGVVGTVLTALQVLSLNVDPGVLLLPAALLVLSNVAWQERQGRLRAERARDELQATLDARPDPAAIVRAFLRLHDEGYQVLQPFGAPLEEMRSKIPEGEGLYRDWIARCMAAIELYRPSFALRFRQSQGAPRERPPLIVIVKDDDGQEHWLDAGVPDRYRTLVAQSMAVLAEILAAG